MAAVSWHCGAGNACWLQNTRPLQALPSSNPWQSASLVQPQLLLPPAQMPPLPQNSAWVQLLSSSHGVPMVADTLRDLLAARAAGCATVTGSDMFACVRDRMVEFLLGEA